MSNLYFLRRLTEFLEKYIDFREDGYSESNVLKEDFIICGIQILLEHGVFTKEELKKQAGKDYHIIIPEKYFQTGGFK